ncbi:MAG: hypothetical protein FNNCIFGK_00317 [Bacteroidia bacterium]|nr:hypothetical protein [Bacteroidia bacterium]
MKIVVLRVVEGVCLGKAKRGVFCKRFIENCILETYFN